MPYTHSNFPLKLIILPPVIYTLAFSKERKKKNSVVLKVYYIFLFGLLPNR